MEEVKVVLDGRELEVFFVDVVVFDVLEVVVDEEV